MTIEQAAQLLTAVAALLAAVCWPVGILLVVFYFRSPLRSFLHDVNKLSVNAGGVEVGISKEEIAKAASSLTLATAKGASSDAQQGGSGQETANQIANVVGRASRRPLVGTRVLWVDDNPDNNLYEREALEAFGINFTVSRSTDDALQRLRQRRYDLVISDMSRPPEKQAGYELLEKMRVGKDETPFILYTASSNPEYVKEARRRGAFGETNSPQELFQLVVDALSGH